MRIKKDFEKVLKENIKEKDFRVLKNYYDFSIMEVEGEKKHYLDLNSGILVRLSIKFNNIVLLNLENMYFITFYFNKTEVMEIVLNKIED